MARPQQSYFLVAKRILQFIKHIQDYSILYQSNNTSNLFDYVDFDWIKDMKHASFIFSIDTTFIFWSIRK